MIAGAITPSGHSNACLCGCVSQDGAGTKHGCKAIGGWKFGNTIDGCQAEYVLVPDAMANLAPVPDGLDRRAGADVPGHHVDRLQRRGERRHPDRRHGGGVRAGSDRPVRHRRREADAARPRSSASTRVPDAAGRCRAGSGADHVVDFRTADPVEEIMRLTDGRGVDVAIEALGTQATFEAALRGPAARAARCRASASTRPT